MRTAAIPTAPMLRTSAVVYLCLDRRLHRELHLEYAEAIWTICAGYIDTCAPPGISLRLCRAIPVEQCRASHPAGTTALYV
jgi:hypothetical protein